MIDERHVFALRFRELAEQFAAFANRRDPMKEYAADTAAGEVTIAAYHL